MAFFLLINWIKVWLSRLNKPAFNFDQLKLALDESF